jgi:hypothetical protein
MEHITQNTYKILIIIFLTITHNNSKEYLTKGSIYIILKILIDIAFKNLIFRVLDKYFIDANPISHYGIYTL